jgi:hypothetical protein
MGRLQNGHTSPEQHDLVVEVPKARVELPLTTEPSGQIYFEPVRARARPWLSGRFGTKHKSMKLSVVCIPEEEQTHAEKNRAREHCDRAADVDRKRGLLHRSGEGHEEVQGRGNPSDGHDMDPDRSGFFQDPKRCGKADQDSLRGKIAADLKDDLGRHNVAALSLHRQ